MQLQDIIRPVDQDEFFAADLPFGVLLSAAVLLVSSMSGLALIGWTSLQLAVPEPGVSPRENSVWTWLFILFLGCFLAFAMWTAVGLFSRTPHARRGILHLAQSLISVGLTSGIVCLYLMIREDMAEMRTASILLFAMAALGSLWKIYFRIPRVVRLFEGES